MKSSASKIQLAGFDDLFQTSSEAEANGEQVREVPLTELFPFKDHPFQVRDDEAMQKTVASSGGDGDVGKDLVPLGEGLVGGKDGGRLLISPGNQLEEQVCALDVHGEVADLVDDKHPVLGENLELVRQTVLKMGLLELLNKLMAVDVVGGKAMLCRHKAQSGGQMGLAHAGRAKEDHILPVSAGAIL